MGKLVDKRIEIIRNYIDPTHVEPIPDFDYTAIYPVTSYAAVHRTLEDTSTTLEDDMEFIRNKFEEYQPLITGGTAGYLMVWGNALGSINEMEVIKDINPDDTARSYDKIPSERAVGKALDLKADKKTLNGHIEDDMIHVTEEEKIRWNSMAPSEDIQKHIENSDIHTTAEEKAIWNAKADNSELEEHIKNTTNPHRVTAHQVGTYSTSEIDTMFRSVSESFFRYMNIAYDEKTGKATLEEYDENNWNPNYVLGHGEDFPTPVDDTLVYFAVKPSTDYSTNPSNDLGIYRKEPGRSWVDVGVSEMKAGDMLIKYPDAYMCVWIQGRFVFIQTTSEGSGESDVMWRPVIDIEGVLTFVRSAEMTAPDPIKIKGPAGYTPQKNIDYFDGADGIGIPDGGEEGQFIIKTSGADYDTTWMSFAEFLDTYVNPEDLPELLSSWENIKNKPEIYQNLGNDAFGLISQDGITKNFKATNDAIKEIQDILSGSGGASGLVDRLNEHMIDYSNPHRVTAKQIGAVDSDTFLAHTTSKMNPHNVTADQIGLGNVNNTSDADKPISLATQAALTVIDNTIEDIKRRIGGDDQVSTVTWDEAHSTLIFTFISGETLEVVFPIESIFNGMRWDSTTSELVFPLPDSSEKRIKITDLVTDYTGAKSANIETTVNDGIITAVIIPGSVDGEAIVNDVNLRGNPTTTTQPINDNSKHIATTEFIKKNIVDTLDSYDADKILSANMGRILNANKTSVQDVMDIIESTPLANIIDNLTSDDPASALSANMGRQLNLNKADRIHTSESGATFGRSSANLFGHSRAGSIDPLMDGVAELGTDNGYYARADHRHPTDESRAPMYWPEDGNYKMRGKVRVETPPNDANDDRVATTEWVLNSGLVPSKTMIQAHLNDLQNPHQVTPSQIGITLIPNSYITSEASRIFNEIINP